MMMILTWWIADQSYNSKTCLLEQRADGRPRSPVLPQLAQRPTQNTCMFRLAVTM